MPYTSRLLSVPCPSCGQMTLSCNSAGTPPESGPEIYRFLHTCSSCNYTEEHNACAQSASHRADCPVCHHQRRMQRELDCWTFEEEQ